MTLMQMLGPYRRHCWQHLSRSKCKKKKGGGLCFHIYVLDFQLFFDVYFQ